MKTEADGPGNLDDETCRAIGAAVGGILARGGYQERSTILLVAECAQAGSGHVHIIDCVRSTSPLHALIIMEEYCAMARDQISQS